MRLVDKKMSLNTTTMSPELVITVALPIEALSDGNVLLTDEAYETQLGKELLKLIKGKK